MPDTEAQMSPPPTSPAAETAPSRAVRFSLTPEDVVHAAQLHFITRMRAPRQIFNICLLGILVTAAAWAAITGLGAHPPLPLLVVIAIASPATGLFAAYGMHERAARKLYAQQKTLQRPFDVSWTDDELRTTSEDGNWRLRWSDFREVKANDKVILFFESDYMMRIIPRRHLTSAQQADLLACAGRTAA
ncbi:hypothetical protein GCM10007301_34610 [Azorhizobium oxalatiphilum]|uniref:YcxB-like C-terminal domain-containing protein n=1 Tax=Azorhizobium oxalatiphilum TaxID=980631 RepID=A0A917C5L0_9HYPH|nr:YcxB family protein [Azorhizobium oxalatiphilum]GGF71944.1 hypothetical protein GCM10007301_34610 [Azorhizobium oxalatiphilum]